MSPTALRLFVAAFPPAPLLADLAHLQDTLRTRCGFPRARWILRPQLHLTLLFLGQVPVERIPTLTTHFASITRTHPTARLRSSACACFPPQGPARGIWLEFTDADHPLADIANALRQQCGHLGDSTDSKPFRPHLTLARLPVPLRGGQAQTLRATLHTVPVSHLPDWNVNELSLMRSVLTPQGPSYSALAHAPLGRLGTPDSSPCE